MTSSNKAIFQLTTPISHRIVGVNNTSAVRTIWVTAYTTNFKTEATFGWLKFTHLRSSRSRRWIITVWPWQLHGSFATTSCSCMVWLGGIIQATRTTYIYLNPPDVCVCVCVCVCLLCLEFSLEKKSCFSCVESREPLKCHHEKVHEETRSPSVRHTKTVGLVFISGGQRESIPAQQKMGTCHSCRRWCLPGSCRN